GRHVSRALDPREVGGSFDVGDAPWVLELDQGFSLTGSYWGDGVGETSTFHDVALTPIDAHRLWTWAGPALPEGCPAVDTPPSAKGPTEEMPLVFVRP